MSGFFLAQPGFALLGLAAPLAVAALYLFQRRFPTRPATGLFLWGRPERAARGGRKFERPPLRRSFWCDFMAALLLALALGRPGWRADTGAPIVVILDDSYALRARNAQAEAVDAVGELARAARRGGRSVALILAGDRPRVAAGPEAPADEFAAALAAADPVAVRPDFAAAVRLAVDLYPTPLDLHIFTDRAGKNPPAPPDSSLTIHRFAGAGPNLAIAGLWREAAPDGRDALYVNAVRHGPASAAGRDEAAALTVAARREGGWEEVHRRILRFDSDGLAAAALDIADVAEIDLAARLRPAGRFATAAAADDGGGGDGAGSGGAFDPDDVIGDDSVHPAPPPPARVLRYAVTGFSPGNVRYLALALDAAGAFPAAAGQPVDLLVTTDPTRRGAAATLEIPAPATGERGGVEAFMPPFVVDGSQPLVRDVHLGGTYWTPAAAEAPPPGNVARPLILAGRRPLFWLSEPGRLHLDIVPEKSGVVRESDWPALFANIVAYARDRLPGPRRALYAPGEPLDYQPLPADAANRNGDGAGDGEGEDGSAPPAAPELVDEAGGVVARAGGGGVLGLPTRAGWYTLRMGGKEFSLAVGLPGAAAAFDTTDLAKAAGSVVSLPMDGTVAAGQRELVWLPLLLALALVLFNWRKGDE